MNFLFGDSTPSQLRSNFLEFLRDAIDFAVFVLEADERIKRGHSMARSLQEESAEENRRLDAFIETVAQAIERAEKGAAESPTASCATRLMGLVGESQRAASAGIQRTLQNDIAELEADEDATREACRMALASLLGPHEPPDATTITMFVLGSNGSYEASSSGSAEVGLDWTFDLEIPDASPWRSAVRVDRLLGPGQILEIRAPQLSGWISKEVKVKPQRLERMIMTKVVQADTTLTLHLRAEIGSESGFDFDVDLADEEVTSHRRGPADDASVGAFDLGKEDAAIIVDLASKVRASIVDLERHRLTSATFDENDFHAQKDFIGFIERFVAMLAPIVREISDRSLTPNELVIRRALGNDRREEIFVAKATLREKYAPLMESQRLLFKPLGLDLEAPIPVKPAPPEVRPPATTLDGPPPMRAELPRSVPPPPIPKITNPPKAQSSTPPPIPSFPDRESEPAIEIVLTPSAEISPLLAQPLPPLPPLPVPPPLPTSHAPPPPSREEPPKNEALVGALKKILMLSRNGRVEEAYADYAALFASPAFADYRPDDQRQALRLMVLSKATPPESDSVRHANEAARARLVTLVDALSDPNDMEMLGVVELALGDEKAALSVFEKALAIEREKSPQSELVATLMRRVSQI